jgi:hypothetical protein
MTHLRRQDIEAAAEGVFQWRNHRYDPRSKARHIAALLHALSIRDQPFDPLLIFPAAGRYFVIDGHHRLAAYERADWKRLIPVEVFNGSLADARMAALCSNSKDKLAMSRVEKSNAAWRLVAEDRPQLTDLGLAYQRSQQQLTDLGLVSPSTIKTMRRQMHKIVEAGEDPLSMDWERARLWPDKPDGYDPDWRDEKVQELVQRLIDSGLATEFNKYPDFAVEALSQIAPGVCEAVIGGTDTDDLEEALEARQEDATFDPNVDADRLHSF